MEEKKESKVKEYTKKFLKFLGGGILKGGRWEIKFTWKF